MKRRPFLSSWIWRVAWRDTRFNRRRLLLFVSSITLGVAALVAIGSFGDNLERAISGQAKTLLGADFVIVSRQPFSEEVEGILASIGGTFSRQINTSTMAYFPKNSSTRLAQVRALSGDFPYYGELETEPPDAARRFQDGPFALVDDGLMTQFEVQVGDRVRIGTIPFRIIGRLRKIPGEAAAIAVVGPRIYIPHRYMKDTGLVQVGSRLGYRAFFKLDQDVDAEALKEKMEPLFREHLLRSETARDRQESLGQSLANLYRFLGMVGFIALLLGSIGVASSIHLYLKQKTSTVAILRCLGARSGQTFAVYILQTVFLGIFGALFGGLLGIGLQYSIPWMLSDFLPLDIETRLSWLSLAVGVLMGLGTCLTFTLLPLLPIRKITPLRTLRSDYGVATPKDSLRWAIYALIGAAIFAFALFQSADWGTALIFMLGVGAVFGILTLTAKLVMLAVRSATPAVWSYTMRQGLANLHRPHNQTVVLMLSLGLGTFLVVTLILIQGSLLTEVSLTADQNRPNLVFFDIQTDQLAEVRQAVRAQGLPILQDVPIVTMRLQEVKGRPVREIVSGPKPPRRSSILVREYRSTYRNKLNDAEELVSGEWIGDYREGDGDVPVSLESRVAEWIGVELGDKLVFDVQGVPVNTYLASLRTIDWQRVQPGFFVVFPTGVLEDAPQFSVVVSRAETVEASALAQRTIVARFPNVSAIDLTLILDTVDAILAKVSFVIRFMALFSVITGLMVLIAAAVTGRFQRIRESVLLRTLGASKTQIRRILLIEYFFLGALAAFTGAVLAVAASWGLTTFVFNVGFTGAALPVLGALVAVALLTLLTGLLCSRGILDRPPLEVLRMEN